MANNNIKEDNGRLKLVDPNTFEYQSTGSTFDSNYNMSVPLEDLCIVVELKTTEKTRTILSSNNQNSAINITNTNNGGKAIKLVNFISGKNDTTTGGNQVLTTSYTDVSDISATTDGINEALGITSIDIEFNSSYAPMVNINFIDVRGAAIFQNGAKSDYGVLFKLPYPIFQLKIKGYYGKPVIYCLHLTKCSTKFNSQTGNFEIAAQFVGYTYAMLSDMLLGYIRAGQETPRGKEIMSQLYPNTLSINDFMVAITRIDSKNPKETNDKFSAVSELDRLIDEINTRINSAITTLNNQNATLLLKSNNPNIVIYSEPRTSLLDTLSNDIQTIKTNFNNICSTNNFPNKYDSNTESPIILNITLNDLKNTSDNATLYREIKNVYGNQGDLDIIIDRLRTASNSIKQTNGVCFFDFTEMFYKLVTQKKNETSLLNNNLIAQAKSSLDSVITNGFNINTSIRGVTNVFTTAVEVFLQQLLEISSKFDNDTRQTELKKIATGNTGKNSTGTGKLDVLSLDNKIYPWPEFSNKGEEAYIGDADNGGVQNPENVPEIQFVNDLFEGFKNNSNIDKNLSAIYSSGRVSYYATNPSDSIAMTYNQFATNPYDRLPSNANEKDMALFMLLRCINFIGFSNKFLTKEEIEDFATYDIQYFLNKFKDSKFLLALKNAYPDPNSFRLIKNSNGQEVITSDGKSLLTYNHLLNGNEAIIPIQAISSNDTSNVIQQITPTIVDNFYDNKSYKFTDYKNHDYVLTNRVYGDINFNNNERYIDIIKESDYNANVTGGKPSKAIDYSKLTTLNTSGDFDTANFVANGGIYGVQEFTKINYGDGDVDFYTLFYGDYSNNNTVLRGTRGKATKYDIKNKTSEYDILIKDETGYKPEVFSNNGSQNFGQTRFLLTNITKNAPYLSFNVQSFTNALGVEFKNVDINLSLFGSRLYNQQVSTNAKAFLFLHSLPWYGLVGKNNIGLFNKAELINIFKYRSGFIQVPALLPAFIGSLLFRLNEQDDIIFWGDKNGSFILNDSLFFDKFINPKKTEFLKSSDNDSELSMTFGNKYYSITGDANVCDITKFPQKIKDLFINEFINFVSDFDTKIGSIFELKTKHDWDTTFNEINTQVTSNNFKLNLNILTNNFVIDGGSETLVNNYNIFNMFNISDSFQYNYNYFLEYKDNSIQSQTLINLLTSKTYISNSSILIWNNSVYTQTVKTPYISNDIAGATGAVIVDVNTEITINSNSPITVQSYDFNVYFQKVVSALNKAATAQSASISLSKSQETLLKFETYRTLKKIYDKWINVLDKSHETSVPNTLFQCCTKANGTADRLSGDTSAALHYGNTKDSLISSFRFIDSSFKDIGDMFFINPFAINKLLLNNINSSFYNVMGTLLTDNHFDFIALPTYVDYKEPDEIKNMFTPYPYYQANTQTIQGPSFVCVYIGQTSTKLDFDSDVTYGHPNDGFDLGSSKQLSGLSDKLEDWEIPAAAFVVRYGHQNQNIFKDIKLDQAEFNETSESLLITDNISNSLGKNNLSYVGQNLYNVYSVRSYKVEVEMMGNAMIQPMMYFQLDNIPMFHGAYLITKVRHSIVPNHMSTVFTGTRIKNVKTPLVSKSVMLNDLLTNFGFKPNEPSINLTKNYVNTYNIILNNNLPKNKFITGNTTDTTKNKITEACSAEFKAFGDGTKTIYSSEGQSRLKEYASVCKATVDKTLEDAWSAVFISYIMNKADSSFPVSTSHYGYVHQAMNGVNGYEVFPLKCGLTIKPEVGDILTFPRDGDFQSSHSNVIFKIEGNKAFLMGGNVLDKDRDGTSVNIREITLDSNGFISDKVQFHSGNDYKLLIKKTGGIYYDHSKNLSDYPIDSLVTSNYRGPKFIDVKQTNAIITDYIPALNRVLPNISTGMKILLQAQTQQEGFIPIGVNPKDFPKGSKSWRDKNPGNVGTNNSTGQERSFNTFDEGIKAQWDKVLGPIFNGKSSQYKPSFTLYDYISKYAPIYDDNGKLAGNDPTSYTNFVINYFRINNIKIDATTTLAQINAIT